MLTIHHLNNSRSQRILWLMEELGLDYELKIYLRDSTTNRAPPELLAIHPLGKSPVITDGDLTLAETGAIIDYIIRKYGEGRLAPAINMDAYEEYNYWLHFAEGSAMLPMLLALYTGFLGDAAAPLTPLIDKEIQIILEHMDNTLGTRAYLAGDELTGADINNSFVLEGANMRGRLDIYPNAKRYLEALQTRPAYKKALKRSLDEGASYNFVEGG